MNNVKAVLIQIRAAARNYQAALGEAVAHPDGDYTGAMLLAQAQISELVGANMAILPKGNESQKARIRAAQDEAARLMAEAAKAFAPMAEILDELVAEALKS